MGFWPTFKTTKLQTNLWIHDMTANTCTCMSFRLGIWVKIIFVNMRLHKPRKFI